MAYQLHESTPEAIKAGNSKYRIIRNISGRFDYRIVFNKASEELFDKYEDKKSVPQKVLEAHWHSLW